MTILQMRVYGNDLCNAARPVQNDILRQKRYLKPYNCKHSYMGHFQKMSPFEIAKLKKTNLLKTSYLLNEQNN